MPSLLWGLSCPGLLFSFACAGGGGVGGGTAVPGFSCLYPSLGLFLYARVTDEVFNFLLGHGITAPWTTLGEHSYQQRLEVTGTQLCSGAGDRGKSVLWR